MLIRMRQWICGAAPLPEELFREFPRRTGVRVLEAYGLTEGTCASSVNPADAAVRVGSIGLHEHPAVALAAAVGRPDAHAGEVPVVYVQLTPGAAATEEELLAYATAHVGERAARPRVVRIVDQLPTTAVGKIFKPSLVLREIEDVCMAVAEELRVPLASVEAAQDPARGHVVRVRAAGEPDALRRALAAFSFHTEFVD
ncbi:MAG: hypothetical protein ABS63_03360 [Microbacterium sp. SCN 70-27]|nr:MAG: hypothetical protein ABS63_03360 [Microbacterium sp. SCN 70-27]